MLNRVIDWFNARYSPVALAKDTQPPTGVRQFMFYFINQFRGAFALRMVLVAIGSIADAMMPIFVGLIVGMLATTPPGEMFTLNWQAFLWMIAVVVLVRPITFVIDTMVRNHAIVPSLVNVVRWQSHWHVIRQSWTYFQNDFAGRIANKIMQAGEAIETAVNLGIDAAWYALIFVVVAVVVLAGLDWVLLVPIAVWMLLYGILFTVTMPLIAKHSEDLSEAKSVMTGRIVDSYTNIHTLKTFSTDGHEDRYVSDSVLEHTVEFRKLMRVFTYMWSILFILNAGLVVSITWIALAGWNQGTLNAAAVATAIPFALQIMNMSGWILEIGSNIFRQIGTVKDSMDTIAQPITMIDSPTAPKLLVKAGDISFDNVSFNYWRGKDGTVMENFNLHIKPGEKVGLVGRSGAGKSTLVNLMLRLFDVESGAIRIDGQDVREVTQESVRAAIGLVSQDTSLLHRSVRENIKYGRQTATDEEMIRAAEQAKVADVIAGLVDPKQRRGYDAHVGERGVKLSGGQRQRVAIARVLLKNAPILVLDEATSALDSEVEAAIQDQLVSLMQGKTVIAIAHRLSTIAAMDRLVVLEKGQIVEEGTHAELLARGGHYAQLWERQSGGFLDLKAETEAAE
jgi:ATP-binding cassette subfamily B multidrug efflux pump